MKKSQRMERLTQLSDLRQHLVEQAFLAAQRDVSTQEAQLVSLRAYQAEYLKRLGDGGSLPGYEAQKLRVFVQRIEKVIATLEYKLRQANQRRERERERLVVHKQRGHALGAVASRTRSLEFKQAENRLQNAIDDLPQVRQAD